jgi:DNA-directed RNA polymerase subunit RPC12/RpoP
LILLPIYAVPGVIWVQRTKSLTRCSNQIESIPISQEGAMNGRTVASYLPSFILPCPYCGRRMSVKTVEPTRFAAEFEDVTHACAQCGTELVRTVQRESGDIKAA